MIILFFPVTIRQRDLRGDAGRYRWIWEGKFLTISDAAILAKKLSILHFDVDESYGTPYIGIDWVFSVKLPIPSETFLNIRVTLSPRSKILSVS